MMFKTSTIVAIAMALASVAQAAAVPASPEKNLDIRVPKKSCPVGQYIACGWYLLSPDSGPCAKVEDLFPLGGSSPWDSLYFLNPATGKPVGLLQQCKTGHCNQFGVGGTEGTYCRFF